MTSKNNPLDVYRRQKHKKELEKNKKARISARDSRVVETKTAREISEQIKELERRGTRNHGETMKLQRLQKELKLVKEAEANRPKALMSEVSSRPLTELDDPRKSVYYHETMNPYGAPPPGKMRLYHRRGGGTTMNKDEAVVPGLEVETISELRREQPHYISGYGQDGPSVQGENTDHDHPKMAPIPPPPPCLPREHQIRSKVVPGESLHQHSRILSSPPPPPSYPPPPPPITVAPPSLPKPSAAVARIRKRKLGADIWASHEEVKYELQENRFDLEEGGLEKVKASTRTESSSSVEWFYLDSFSNLQGPFTSQHMQQWKQAGYFPPQTLVRKNDGQFGPIGMVSFDGSSSEQLINIKSRVARLKQLHEADNEEEAVQARIAALRGVKRDPRKSSEHGEAMGSAASSDQHKDNTENTSPSMRQKQIESIDTDEGNACDTGIMEHQKEECFLVNGVQPNEVRLAMPVEDVSRIDADSSNLDARPSGNFQEPLAYPLAEIHELPTYPVDELEEPPAYPADDFEGPPPYPVPHDFDYGYPVDDGVDDYPDDTEHPVFDVYPVFDDNGAYPVDSVDNADYERANTVKITSEEISSSTQKKVVEIDKEIVGLMPSHLHKKRRAAKSSDKPPVNRPQAPGNPTLLNPSNARSIGDDYDKFMKELSGL